MFENFVLTNNPVKIAGYDFPCENPDAVMLIIHGIGEYAGRYSRMSKSLSEKHIKVYSMDLPGHGISGGVRGDAAPRIEVLYCIDKLINFAKEKFPDKPIVLYGHSMGGNIALDYKYRGNQSDIPSAFIISAPWIRLVRPVSKPLYLAIKASSKLIPKARIKSECDEKVLGNLIYVKPYASNPLVHPYITMRCAYEGFEIGTAIENGTWVDYGKSAGKPFLLMQGTEDKLCDVNGARALAQQNNGKSEFEYVEWPGYYHEIHNGNMVETGEEVIEKIGNFIVQNVIKN